MKKSYESKGIWRQDTMEPLTLKDESIFQITHIENKSNNKKKCIKTVGNCTKCYKIANKCYDLLTCVISIADLITGFYVFFFEFLKVFLYVHATTKKRCEIAKYALFDNIHTHTFIKKMHLKKHRYISNIQLLQQRIYVIFLDFSFNNLPCTNLIFCCFYLQFRK